MLFLKITRTSKVIFSIATIAILITISLGLARAFLGPTVYDRILAVNMVGTKTVLLIAVFAVLSGRTNMIDIALMYALINFIGVVAVLKFVGQGNFYTSGED
jgi:multicomponent Na+:H+ antiporter subunit F